MTSQKDDENRAEYVIRNQKVLVTIQDGVLIKNALMTFLDTSTEVSSIPFLDKQSPAWILNGDDVWIDADKKLRVGVWVLQSIDDNFVLIYRPVPAGEKVSYRYLCHVNRNKDEWRVSKIDFEKVYSSR